jgi:hypothetical protein
MWTCKVTFPVTSVYEFEFPPMHHSHHTFQTYHQSASQTFRPILDQQYCGVNIPEPNHQHVSADQARARGSRNPPRYQPRSRCQDVKASVEVMTENRPMNAGEVAVMP